ncbi:tRNA (5-methylaminomethyl-2-thiouridine)(34)-methyltransferase MnmD [Rhizobium sp. TRM96647]|uniref:tRNA (5-methylaminomethyl-2-thiouridine)(34)-methyltransferase MnmD n=1 Tax=unclassified Rhizobium TaxID=2613769 RepID=UPI0021E90B6E|nr:MULTISPECIES: tRNA (5-methylaminomethyl-2-thiouridine)(34)-methyltransferase MnmD [unclassified Rhizobium]MCV3738153.1 tRNA (5-methylaminomethyl-2-thiouridine)(34)-methyltransferase MnmD [Rhizobium sp. TRM96647]MCV3759840.1 tRNA (5-methylaminomethyl-2-thiouridine)(34)-methyltransferase MnmD [Rhizobium sp. TRM96650]
MAENAPENAAAANGSTSDRTPDLALDWHEGDMPYSQAYGDHFYCRTDGRLECGHVFLDGNGLPSRWSDGGDFTIGELGFGTGLNLCETWRQWRAARGDALGTLHFVSFERFPLPRAAIDRALSHWPQIDRERAALSGLWPEAPEGHGAIALELDERTRLTVVCGPALEGLQACGLSFDAWYLDGFAPSRNPDMWSAELIGQVFGHTCPGGTFATYAAAGFVRRNLAGAGFAVERRPGFAGKREMLCGRRP